MATYTYKFGPKPVHTAVKSYGREKTAATVRYDDEREVQPDDWIEIVKANSERTVGYAIVNFVETVELREALDVIEQYGALYGIDSYDELIAAMHEYYDPTITATSEVTVILYQTINLAR